MTRPPKDDAVDRDARNHAMPGNLNPTEAVQPGQAGVPDDLTDQRFNAVEGVAPGQSVIARDPEFDRDAAPSEQPPGRKKGGE